MEQHVLMKPCLVPSASGVRLCPNSVSQTHAAWLGAGVEVAVGVGLGSYRAEA